jgi:VWFA-related protein
MRRPVTTSVLLFVPLLATLMALPACAQSPQAPPATPAPPPPGPDTTVLQTGTQLVVVDVVVEDKGGNPVHRLKAEDFQLTEGKVPQVVRHFEEHSTQNPPAPGPEMRKLPPGTYTNYTPVPPSGTLNVLLLDALNTPMADQAFVRNQLQDYVKHADPGTRIAIFGLASELILLQGFTSDPETLKNVVDHKLIPRASHLLDDPVSGGDVDQPSDMIDASAPGMANIAANMQQFEAQTAAFQLQLRAQYTLDAFNSLAHYLAAFPGRKNLIWFSGSFPLDILPDPTLNDPFSVMQLDEQEFRETTNLLTKAQVAVYPVDARGLMTLPAFSASNSGAKYARSPTAFSAAVQKFGNSQAAEHSTMNLMAEDTGGRAFYNTNGLAQAVAKAVREGSNYYTLTYTPTNRKHDGSYRDIRVSVAPGKDTGLQLSYRHGYYDEDPALLAKKKSDLHDTATTTESASSSLRSGAAYARAAMARGAPTPEDLLFKVRVLPASTQAETSVANGNQLDPLTPAKGPFHRYVVDYAAIPSEFTMALQPDGTRTGEIAFLVNVYDRNGRMLNTNGRGFKVTMKPDAYKAFLGSAIQCRLEISVPDRAETFLRIGVEDVSTNRFGVVELPTADVSRLPPAVDADAKPAPAANSAPSAGSTSPAKATPPAARPPR